MNPWTHAGVTSGRTGACAESRTPSPGPRRAPRRGRIVFWLILPFTAVALEPSLRIAPPQPDGSFTFAVLGDNRGDDTGRLSPAFPRVLKAVREAAPAFVLNTGDMIYGRTEDRTQVREQWRRYRQALASLNAPVFHVPGNHDIWDASSAREYAELWGPSYFGFDHGRARFIGLDTETDPGRLGPTQFRWLRQQLEDAGARIVFVFLHRPLFPQDGAVGSSLDLYPAERDQLHQLFIAHRRTIKAVFLGHEHLFHVHERDGIPYYITGGAGADLYVAPELGGFHHFLLVRLSGDAVTVELEQIGAPPTPPQAPRRVIPGELLESWEAGRFWYAWDYTVTTSITLDRATEGQRGLQMNFDLALYPWPVLTLPLPSPWDLRNVDAVALDVHVPGNLSDSLSLAFAAEGTRKHEAPPVALKPGWNTVRTALQGAWFPAADQQRVRALSWSLAAATSNAFRSSVVFDNLRVERPEAQAAPAAGRLEGWERSIYWRVADESVLAETSPECITEGSHGLKLQLDFSRCPRPILLARLAAPWDLTAVRGLCLDVYVPPEQAGALSLALGLRAAEAAFAAPPVLLKSGWNYVTVPLNDRWLPENVRAAAEQVEWRLATTDQALRGWIACDRLRAEP